MPPSKRKRDSVFSSSYNPANPCRRSQSSHDEGTQLLRRDLASSRPSGPPSLQPQNISTSLMGGLHDRRNDREDIEDESNDDVEQVIMAIDVKDRGTVGCCYYVAREEKLFILGDVQSGSKEIIDSLKLEVQPTTLLNSTRADETVALAHQRPTPEALSHLPYQIDIRPTQEFNAQNAKTRLAALEISHQGSNMTHFLVPSDGLTQDEVQMATEHVGFTAQKGKLLQLAGCIDIENTVSLGCAGAILTYLQRRRTNEYPATDSDSGLFKVRSIESFTLKGKMSINADTLSSLQIILSESHPNAFNQGPGKTSSGAKENLSLYGLFYQHAVTPQGKTRLKKLFLRPSIEIDIITRSHDMIDVLSRSINAPALQKLNSSLKKVKNLRPLMTNLHKGLSNGNGSFGGFKSTLWGTLLSFAFHALDIQETLREVEWSGLADFQSKALRILDAVTLHRVGRLIHETVDIEDSQEQQRTIVKSGVDRELDLLKDRYNGLDSLLKQVAIDIASSIPEDLDIDVNVIYFPQLGFNIAIPFDRTGHAAYSGDEEPWEQVFTTENRAYFKDSRMREMDEKLGDMYGLICEKEIEIAHELAQRVLEDEELLIQASDLCGELDCYLAMVQTASIHKFIRPRMSEQNVIKIKGGRHPLQELAVPSYVPNDITLRGGEGTSGMSQNDASDVTEMPQSPSMLLLTGPNYSGKSIYLKQVALTVYLAHIGSFVPAQSADIGITDKLLTRLTTPETVSKIQSTFMIDLQQVSLALKSATNKSLLIIDEFGKGTDLNDGAGLACGIFEYLLSLGNQRPKVLAATHFHEIFENGFLRPRPHLGFGHMEIRVDKGARETGEQITYLYNFLPGRSNESFGTFCAAMNGIDPAIIARANDIAALSARGENLVAVCAKLSKAETDILEGAETIARKFLEMSFSFKSLDIRGELSALLGRDLDNDEGNEEITTKEPMPAI